MKTVVHQYEDKLLDYAYGELSASEATAVSEHAKGCTRCASHLAEIESTRSFMKQLAPVPAPLAGLDSLLAYAEQAAAKNAKSAKQSVPFFKRYFTPLLSAAALAVVGLVAWQNSNQSLVPDPAAAAFEIKNEAKKEAQAASTREGKYVEDVPAAAAAPALQKEAERRKSDESVDLLKSKAIAEYKQNGPGLPEEVANKKNFADTKPVEKPADSEGLRGAGAKEQWVAQDALAEKVGKLGTSPKPEMKYEAKRSESLPPSPSKMPSKDAPDTQTRKQADESVGRLSSMQNVQNAVVPSGSSGSSSGGGYGLSGSGTTSPSSAPPAPATVPKVSAAIMDGNSNEVQGGKGSDRANEPVVATGKTSQAPMQAESAYGDYAADKKAPPKKKSLSIPSSKSEGSVSANDDFDMASTSSVQVAREESLTKRDGTKARSLDLEAARQAGASGDRLMEIKHAKDVLASGATGYERIEALKRLCDAYDAIGNASAGAQYCQALIAEYPASAAARAVNEKQQQRAVSPKKAAPAKAIDSQESPVLSH
jgi:hypothetical protein